MFHAGQGPGVCKKGCTDPDVECIVELSLYDMGQLFKNNRAEFERIMCARRRSDPVEHELFLRWLDEPVGEPVLRREPSPAQVLDWEPPAPEPEREPEPDTKLAGLQAWLNG
jgi:hypothetical protein